MLTDVQVSWLTLLRLPTCTLRVPIFFKWPPMNIVLMFYTFREIKQMEKIALINSPKTYTSFDVKLTKGNRSSTNNLVNTFPLKTYEQQLNLTEILRISLSFFR